MIETNTTKVERVATANNYGRFQIEPLEPGFGTTIGNALRRVLLSSLPGAAITSVRIEGVYHEFSDIPDVKEDTTELILNLKQIRLRSFSDRPVQLVLESTGPGRVTAADILTPPEVEIVNPEQHIATLNSADAKLNMEMTVERGKGYVPADNREGLPIGVIPVDAIYAPVQRVNYTVEHTRVGQVTDYDRLILEVKTDGTITPEDAVAQAAEILVSNFALLARIGGKAAIQIEKQAVGPAAIPQKVYDTPIEELDLSVRAYNCLKRVGITKVGQVLEMSEEDLLGVRNFGRKSLDELREKLEARGFIAGSRLAESAQASEAEAPEPEEAELAQPVVTAEEAEREEAPVEEEEATEEVEQKPEERLVIEERPEPEEAEAPAERPEEQIADFEMYDEDFLERLEEEEKEEMSRKKKRRVRREK